MPMPPDDPPGPSYKQATEWLMSGMPTESVPQPDPPPPAEAASAAAETQQTQPEPVAPEVAEVLQLDEERRRRRAEALHTKNKRKRAVAGGGQADTGEESNRPRDKTFKSLPDDCPVICLGIEGDKYHFLDAAGQHLTKTAEKMGLRGIDDLFKGQVPWMLAHYPRRSMYGNINGVDKEMLGWALMGRCRERGVFDPTDRIFGVGAWRADDGELVWHMGDSVAIYSAGERRSHEPGLVGDKVFPLGDTQPRPAIRAEAGASFEEGGAWQGPIGEVLALLERWHWRRGALDARLYLGCIAAGIIGGALRVRPNSWVIGDYASGKSELQAVAVELMGGSRAVIHSADASGAGIRQALRNRSLAVILDEVEPRTDNTRRQAIMELARVAATGGKFTRGGATHEGIEFIVRSSFFFTSVLRLPLAPQDLSRLVLLELRPPAAGARRPQWSAGDLQAYGRILRRRLIDHWHRFESALFPPWWEYLAPQIGGRPAEVYGTALALQHVALFDHAAEPAEIASLCAPVIADVRQIAETTGHDHEQAAAYLASSPVEVGDKRQQFAVSTLAIVAGGLAAQVEHAQRLARVPAGERTIIPDDMKPELAEAALLRHGLRITAIDGAPYLALQLQGGAVDRLFRGQHWQSGVWVQAFERCAGMCYGRRRFDGSPKRCLLVPLAAIVGDLVPAPAGETEETGEETGQSSADF